MNAVERITGLAETALGVASKPPVSRGARYVIAMGRRRARTRLMSAYQRSVRLDLGAATIDPQGRIHGATLTTSSRRVV